MIKSKSDYKSYIKEDLKYYNDLYKGNKFKIHFCIQVKYLKCMRKVAYLKNSENFIVFRKIRLAFAKYKYLRLSLATGISIGVNCFGQGLVLPHFGTIIVNNTARFGDNCVVQCGVNVSDGVCGGSHIYLSTGAKILRNIKIANDVIVGANAVVTHDVADENIVVAGIPAKYISNNGFRNRDVV